MAKLLVLWRSQAQVRIGQAEVLNLEKLGVTSIALLRDDTSIGVVLDGWAFDVGRSGARAAAVIADEPPMAQLSPVAEIGFAGAASAPERT